MKLIENVSRHVSRRGFLQGALASGVFVLSARFIPEPLWAAEGEAAAPAFEPSLWMSIASDGTVTIVAHRSEMGCGSRTALPLVVADELDADWSKVKIDQAIGDPKYGEQDTDGSHSVRSNFDLMRQVGATGRVMLISAAAAQWGVSPKDCTTEPHFVVHRASGRKLGYGELAAAAAKLPVPKKEDVPLKDRSQWRYIGKESNSLFDLPEIVTGKAIFGMDATMPGMVFASVEHPPVLGQKIKSYDDKAALKVPGVQKTLTIDTFKPPHLFQPLGGVAVIADNTWAAFKGRKSLKIEWDSSPHAVYNSAPFRKTLEATSRQPGKVVRNVGDVDAAFAKGVKDHRGRVLHSASGTRFHGAAGRRRRVSRRKSAGLGPDAESASRAGDDCRRARHQERRRDLPCHAAWRRLRAQVETRSGRGSRRSFQTTGQAGQGGLEPRRRHSLRFFPLRRCDVHEGRHWARWQADGVAAAHGVSADQFNLRRFRHLCRRRDGLGMEQSSLRYSQPSRRKWTRRLPRADWMAAQRGEHLSCVRDSLLCRRTGESRQQRFGRSICSI